MLRCLRQIDYSKIVNKKNLNYSDSLLNAKCFTSKMKYLVPNKFYLMGVGYQYSEGLYVSVYIKKFRFLKNRIDQKPWRKKLLLKETVGIIKLYFYEKLICEYQ